MIIIWCMVPEIWSTTDVIFCHFDVLPLPSHPENQNSEKMKKTSENIILPICTVDGNHMMYGSRYMELWSMTDKFFVILGHFLSFTPLKTKKIEILKKWWKHKKILSFYTSVTKIMITCHTVPEILCGVWRMEFLFFILGYFLPLYTPNDSKNQNFEKIKKTSGDIILQISTRKYDFMM